MFMSSELRKRIDGRRRIYLLRHGEVSYFDERGMPSPLDSLPLNRRGILQAEAAREFLRDVPFDRAVHTGLPRTRETARIVLEPRRIPLESCPGLREVAPGPLQARPEGSSFEAHFTGALGGSITRETRFLGGESFGELEARVLPALLEILAAPGWKHCLIAAHGGTNRLILLHALGAGMESFGRIEQEPACINLIDVHAEGALLVRQVNFTPHSPGKDGVWATTMENVYLEHYDAIASIARARELTPRSSPDVEAL